MAEYTLYSYFRSSCSARLRIALNLKGLQYELIPINILHSENQSASFKALNPSGLVPLLVSHAPSLRISQSIAALEYLEEVHPGASPALLPPREDVRRRAAVRTLVGIIAADTQPTANLRIARRVVELGGTAEAWNRDLMEEGLSAYEKVVREWAGEFSVGDVSLADVCLMPAVWNAQRVKIPIEEYPVIARIVGRMGKLETVEKAHWLNQPDTPEQLKAAEG